MGRAILRRKARPIVKYRDTLHCSHLCKNWLRCRLGMLNRVEPKNHILDGGKYHPWEGTRMRRACLDTHDNILTSTVQKWLNRSRCRLGCVRAHWRHLANTNVPSVCGSDVALCQIIWPLVIIITPAPMKLKFGVKETMAYLCSSAPNFRANRFINGRLKLHEVDRIKAMKSCHSYPHCIVSFVWQCLRI